MFCAVLLCGQLRPDVTDNNVVLLLCGQLRPDEDLLGGEPHGPAELHGAEGAAGGPDGRGQGLPRPGGHRRAPLRLRVLLQPHRVRPLLGRDAPLPGRPRGRVRVFVRVVGLGLGFRPPQAGASGRATPAHDHRCVHPPEVHRTLDAPQ